MSCSVLQPAAPCTPDGASGGAMGNGCHHTPTAAENQAADDDFCSSPERMMALYKVQPCAKRYCHDWTTCPYAHPGEKARRRDPSRSKHTGIACPDMKRHGCCPRGDQCPYAHNVFEYWLHPTRYRTQLCNDGDRCARRVCFFAHRPEEVRTPDCKPFVPPEVLAALQLDESTAVAAPPGAQWITCQTPPQAAQMPQAAQAGSPTASYSPTSPLSGNPSGLSSVGGADTPPASRSPPPGGPPPPPPPPPPPRENGHALEPVNEEGFARQGLTRHASLFVEHQRSGCRDERVISSGGATLQRRSNSLPPGTGAAAAEAAARGGAGVSVAAVMAQLAALQTQELSAEQEQVLSLVSALLNASGAPQVPQAQRQPDATGGALAAAAAAAVAQMRGGGGGADSPSRARRASPQRLPPTPSRLSGASFASGRLSARAGERGSSSAGSSGFGSASLLSPHGAQSPLPHGGAAAHNFRNASAAPSPRGAGAGAVTGSGAPLFCNGAASGNGPNPFAGRSQDADAKAAYAAVMQLTGGHNQAAHALRASFGGHQGDFGSGLPPPSPPPSGFARASAFAAFPSSPAPPPPPRRAAASPLHRASIDNSMFPGSSFGGSGSSLAQSHNLSTPPALHAPAGLAAHRPPPLTLPATAFESLYGSHSMFSAPGLANLGGFDLGLPRSLSELGLPYASALGGGADAPGTPGQGGQGQAGGAPVRRSLFEAPMLFSPVPAGPPASEGILGIAAAGGSGAAGCLPGLSRRRSRSLDDLLPSGML